MYPSVKPKKKWNSRLKAPACYEELLYLTGNLDFHFLEQDLDFLLHAMREFQPDYVIEIERPAAIIASQSLSVPTVSVVQANAYLKRDVNPACLNDINRLLTLQKQVQILRLKDLYNRTQLRVAFGPYSFQRFAKEENVNVFGSLSPQQKPYKPSKKITLLFSDTRLPKRELKQLIFESFLGSSYTVNLYMPICSVSTKNNIHVLKELRTALIQDSEIIIHDGNDYIIEECFRLGIPQEIVTDGDYRHEYNGLWVTKLGAGKSIRDYETNVAYLYETFRALVTDPKYRKKAGHYARQINQLGDINDFVKSLE